MIDKAGAGGSQK